MKKLLLTLALVLFAANAQAGILNLGGSLQAPSSGLFELILENNHTADLTGLSLTIGDTTKNFDFAQVFSSELALFDSANIEVVAVGNTSGNGGLRADTFVADFTGFIPGTRLDIVLDIDNDAGQTGSQDPRNVLLPNNAMLSVLFADGGTVDFTFDENFSFDGAPNVELEVQPIPVPAAVWLLGAGLAGLVGLRKRG